MNLIQGPALTDVQYYAGRLLASFPTFVSAFYPIVTGRSFNFSETEGREPYQLTMMRELRNVFDGNLKDANGNLHQHLMINIPPRYGKTTLLHYFVAWCFARHPDCNFLYISYEKDLAALQTFRIREIIHHPEFFKYFGVNLSCTSRA